jgi:hypothetical protein
VKRLILTLLSILFGAFLMLGPVYLMLIAVLQVEQMTSALWRPTAILGLLVIGVLLFVGSAYISTHLVVFFFRRKPDSPSA